MHQNKYSKEADKLVREFYGKRRRVFYPTDKILISPDEINSLNANDERDDQIFYIEKGRVIQYTINSRGEKVILNIFKEGAFFPMNYALTGKKSKYFFATDGEVMTRQAPTEEVLQFLENNSVVMFDLMSRVASGLEGVFERLGLAMSGSLESRVLAELHLSAERFGYYEDEDGGRTLEMPLSVTRLAELVGASREATSRVVNQLIREHKIKRQNKIYTLC